MVVLEDELYGWPSAVCEQGAWVRKAEDAPIKKLANPQEKEGPEVLPIDDDWYLGAYRRFHEGEEQPRSRDDKPFGRIVEVPYEERVTVAMFAKRSGPRNRAPTRSELYREAQRKGIEGRSRMNKSQLVEALEEKEG